MSKKITTYINLIQEFESIDTEAELANSRKKLDTYNKWTLEIDYESFITFLGPKGPHKWQYVFSENGKDRIHETSLEWAILLKKLHELFPLIKYKWWSYLYVSQSNDWPWIINIHYQWNIELIKCP